VSSSVWGHIVVLMNTMVGAAVHGGNIMVLMNTMVGAAVYGGRIVVLMTTIVLDTNAIITQQNQLDEQDISRASSVWRIQTKACHSAQCSSAELWLLYVFQVSRCIWVQVSCFSSTRDPTRRCS
jgi:hypothetical protein